MASGHSLGLRWPQSRSAVATVLVCGGHSLGLRWPLSRSDVTLQHQHHDRLLGHVRQPAKR